MGARETIVLPMSSGIRRVYKDVMGTLRPSWWERLQFIALGPRDVLLYLISSNPTGGISPLKHRLPWDAVDKC